MNAPESKSDRTDRQLLWICVPAYFLAWLAILSSGLTLRLLLPAALLAAIYAGMHFYEMTRRQHVALSADASALPAAFGAAIAGSAVAYVAGVPWATLQPFVLNVPMAWIGGHLAVFALIFLLDKLGIVK